MKFNASFDSQVKLVSVVCFFLFIGISIHAYTHFTTLHSALIISFLWLLFFLCYALSPKFYLVDKFQFTGKSPLVSFVYPKKEIVNVQLVSEAEMRGV
jgi:hypothetical protein